MRNRRNLTILWIILAVVLVAALAGLSWQNYRYAKSHEKGANEFLVHWMSTRDFLTSGVSPYSDETAQKIETFAYGHPAQGKEMKLRMVYPLYSIAVFFPFALVPDYATARAAYMTVLEVLLVVLIIFSLRLARWRMRFLEMLLFVVFAAFWYHGLQPLLDGNVSILVAVFLAAGFLALKNGGDELAGILFAFATIKPNVVFWLMVFLAVYSLFNGRWRLLGWLVGTLFLLSASAALLLPDWIRQNLSQLIVFSNFAPPSTLGAILSSSFPAMGQRIARLLYGLLAGMLVAEWWSNRRAEFPGFFYTSMFTLTVGQWLLIPTGPENFIVLLPAVALVFATWEERWRRAGRALTWVSMALLFAGIWGIFLTKAQFGAVGVQNKLLFLPLIAYLIVTLYWVRWWAIHPPSLWFDLIYRQEHS